MTPTMLAAASDSMEVLLQFAFLAVLYLFLLWIVTSALRDLRRPVPDSGVPFQSDDEPARRGWLVVQGGSGLRPGDSFELGEDVTIGRSAGSEITISDSFASGSHARIRSHGGSFYLEDLQSTNGTYVNGQRVDGEVELRMNDVVRIGDTELRYEEE